MTCFCYHILFLMVAAVSVNPSTYIKSSNGMQRTFFQGRQFKIGIINIPPYVLAQYDTGGNISYVDGFVPQMISWMAEKYDFTFKYVEPPDEAFGAFINGSWNGLIGMVVREEIEIVGTALSVTYPRSLVVDYTCAFSEDPISLLIPFPQLDSTISGIIKPFQYEVWIGIFLCLLIASVVIWLISRVQWRIYRQSFYGQTGWFPHFWFLFRVVTNPSGVITFTLATRIVVASWLLMGTVFVNCYTSSLLSYLMAPTFLPLISTVQDLADSRDIQIAAPKHSSVDSALFAATTGPFAKLGESLRAHPENLLSMSNNIEDIVFHQRKAFSYQETSLKQRIYNDFRSHKQCRLFIAKEHLFPDQIAFALAKRSPLTKAFNYEVTWLRQLGLLKHWINSYLPRPYRCSAPLSSFRPTPNERLTLNYLSSAFLLYGVGISVSVLAFTLEIIFTWWKRHAIKVTPFNNRKRGLRAGWN
ncbi:glutamate receptor ionotropic, delta-2-like [Daphnia carinata]|uniref:glutamate receptor ionotropic, delta-2-like n=1 Tax=Daphnia carinata TaxID=120202 RepID=UPI00286974C8|nr:glutamate receptor ionotropic, delta-2-like [Daphnia carinata]